MTKVPANQEVLTQVAKIFAPLATEGEHIRVTQLGGADAGCWVTLRRGALPRSASALVLPSGAPGSDLSDRAPSVMADLRAMIAASTGT